MKKNDFKRLLRTWHRRLGVLIGIQLLLWTVGGVYFSWFHIDNVHGDYERNFSPSPPITDRDGLLPVRSFLEQTQLEQVQEIRIGWFLDRIVARLYANENNVEMYDALSGEILSPITKEQGIELARTDFLPKSEIVSVEAVSEKRGEYKGPIPAFRITFDNPKATHVYVHTKSGIVTAHRNKVWRVFDFLWMFHIMDYDQRDDLNNWILRILSLLSLITILSGFLLWGAGFWKSSSPK